MVDIFKLYEDFCLGATLVEISPERKKLWDEWTKPEWKKNGVGVSKIELYKLQKYCRIAFEGDADLWEKYHQGDKNFEDTVINNIRSVIEISQQKAVFCYSISFKNEIIGFFVLVEDILLYSFGINKNYRTREITTTWLNMVKDLMPSDFIVCLRSENTRAINFFVRNDFEIFSQDDQDVTLIYKK